MESVLLFSLFQVRSRTIQLLWDPWNQLNEATFYLQLYQELDHGTQCSRFDSLKLTPSRSLKLTQRGHFLPSTWPRVSHVIRRNALTLTQINRLVNQPPTPNSKAKEKQRLVTHYLTNVPMTTVHSLHSLLSAFCLLVLYPIINHQILRPSHLWPFVMWLSQLHYSLQNTCKLHILVFISNPYDLHKGA